MYIFGSIASDSWFLVFVTEKMIMVKWLPRTWPTKLFMVRSIRRALLKLASALESILTNPLVNGFKARP